MPGRGGTFKQARLAGKQWISNDNSISSKSGVMVLGIKAATISEHMDGLSSIHGYARESKVADLAR